MITQTWIILTTEEKDAAMELNDDSVNLGPREVNNPDAGELLGKWVAPSRLLEDHDYSRWWPTLSSKPVLSLNSSDLFLQTEFEF